MKGLRALIALPLILFLFLVVPANATAGTVTPCSICSMGTPIGTLTPLNAQTYNNAAGFKNGTMFFNVTGVEVAQAFYQFTVNYFGNGTLTLIFNSPLVPTVTATFGLAISIPQSQERITYTSQKSQTDSLCIVYSGNCGQGSISSPGGGSGGFIPPAIQTYFGPSFFIYQIAAVAAIIGLIFVVGIARNRRKSKK